MELKAFYVQVGGSYEETISRLMNERIMNKYIRRFPADPTYTQLEDAVAAKDWETAFRAVHTMKGVAANLGFGRLLAGADALTEALRGNKPLEDASLLKQVEDEYAAVIAAIGALD